MVMKMTKMTMKKNRNKDADDHEDDDDDDEEKSANLSDYETQWEPLTESRSQYKDTTSQSKSRVP